MTSPVATYGTRYDGSDLQLADLSIFFQLRRGLHNVPSVRGKDTTVPARRGRITEFRDRVADTLELELYGWVRADASATTVAEQRESYEENQQAIRALFHTERDPADLELLMLTRTLTISARPLNIVPITEVPGHITVLSIELEGMADWVTEVAS